MTNLFLLCGGRGTRFESIFPKPLNLVQGKPLVYHAITSLGLEKLTNGYQLFIVYNAKLESCNFKEILCNMFPKLRFHFVLLNYYTRGASESAYLGVQQAIAQLKAQEEHSESAKEALRMLLTNNILFLDNDTIYPSETWQYINQHHATNFVWTNYNTEKEPVYSYVVTDDNNLVTDIQEKVKLSDLICVGGYGFVNYTVFFRVFELILAHNIKTKNEFYMSLIYQYMLTSEKSEELQDRTSRATGTQVPLTLIPATLAHPYRIQSIVLNRTICMGTPNQLRVEAPAIIPLRYVFDLDNTLVTYPTIPKDYSSVKPITKMIDLVQKLHKDGHTIIIATARRMLTHHHNVGAVVADIGRVTMDTLQKFNIPYHELIFGKPIGDVYIDDRAFNPYDDRLFKLLGEYSLVNDDIENKIPNNQFNEVRAYDDFVYKSFGADSKPGEGELYFYQNLYRLPEKARAWFPTFYGATISPEGRVQLKLEKINGIPLSFVFHHRTYSLALFRKLLVLTHELHSIKPELPKENSTFAPRVAMEHYASNYLPKLVARFANKVDYSFPSAESIFKQIHERMTAYVTGPTFEDNIVDVIHGDLWFSNILLTGQDSYKILDMKGLVANSKTLSGDRCYDYAKLLQSLIGFDAALYGQEWDEEYATPFINAMKEFLETEAGLDFSNVASVCAANIFGVFWAYRDMPMSKKIAIANVVERSLNL